MKKFFIFVLLILVSFLCFGEDNRTSSSSEMTDIYPDLLPEPYDVTDYPEWLMKTRRATVVFAGSYPLSVFFTKIGMDFFDYAYHGFDSDYSPSIFGGGGGDRTMSKDDVIKVSVAALAVSGAVALADFIIQEIKEKKHPEKFQEEKAKRAAKYRERKMKKALKKEMKAKKKEQDSYGIYQPVH